MSMGVEGPSDPMNMAWALFASRPRVDRRHRSRAGNFSEPTQRTIHDQSMFDSTCAHHDAEFGRLDAVAGEPAGADRLSPRCDETLRLAYRQVRRDAGLPGAEQGQA